MKRKNEVAELKRRVAELEGEQRTDTKTIEGYVKMRITMLKHLTIRRSDLTVQLRRVDAQIKILDFEPKQTQQFYEDWAGR